MNSGTSREWYLALSDSEKLIALALVAYHLTIHGRDFGADLTLEAQARAFKGLNELQHQLTSHIAAVASLRGRYPDEVLWTVLEEKATFYGLGVHLAQSFDHARTGTVFTNSAVD